MIPFRRVLPLLGVLSVVVSSPAWAMGLLIPNQEGAAPLAIESHRVDVQIRDNLAVTHIDEVFRNSSPTQLEATFIFPVPAGATVHDFALYINGARVQGEILEATQARQVYENIVRRVRDPGLVEYVDGTIFQASIFPVPANGTQRVELEFAQVLELSGELHRFVYPLRTGRTSATTLTDFTISADITSTSPIRAIYSPTHEIDVVRESENHAVVGLEQRNADLERDFVLYLSASDEDVGVTLFTFDEDGNGGEPGFFLMLVTPRLEREGEIAAKDVTFVVDTSGSMTDGKLEQAQATMRQAIGMLGENDRFNIVRFSTTSRNLFDDLTPVDETSTARALRFVDDFRAAGGTAIEAAMRAALSQSTDPARPHFVIFITDGLPTVGETSADAIVAQVAESNGGNARIFSFGVGYDVDTNLLDRMASLNGGTSDYVRPTEDIEVPVSNLVDRISHPVLTGLSIDFGDAEVDDLYPTAIPDLFAGQQVVLAGRYATPITSEVTLAGTTNGQSLSYRFEEDFSRGGDAANAENDFIPQLWATRAIGFLIDQIRLNGETVELRDEVMHLGLRYGLVTPYTSYLAVDDSELGVPGDPGPMWNQPTTGVPQATAMPMEEGEASGWGMRRERDRASLDSTSEAPDEVPTAPMAGSGGFDLGSVSGETAVEAAVEARTLQETEIADRRTPVQQIGGRNMQLGRDGTWREDGVNDESGQHVRIRYLSDAYFRLLDLGGEVSRVLGVGESVTFVLPNGTIVEVLAADGLETLDAASEALLGL